MREVPELLERKGNQRVCVIFPVLDAEATVERAVSPLVTQLGGLVDEVLVVDAGSADRTVQRALAVGARVLHLPPSAHGYSLGDRASALWWAQLQTASDMLLILDSDEEPARLSTATRLLTPLLVEPEVAFVKAAFDRPLTIDGVLPHGSSGRVTELLARPVLNAWWPQLAGFVQPLSGEFAVRRKVLAQLSFARGFGLEVAMLIDVLSLVGLNGLAQVDVGQRRHRQHTDAVLGRMAAEVLSCALDRYPSGPNADHFVQFTRAAVGFEIHDSEVHVCQLPPAISLGAGPRSSMQVG